MLIEPTVLEKLERLALVSRARLAGLFPGEHRSRKLGSSQDFADRRPYVLGDDYRRIDVAVLARLDRLYVRLYEAEEELDLRLVLDASASMDFHGKLVAAKRLSAALAYLAACRKDRAQFWVCDQSGMRQGPPMRSKDSALVAFNWLEGIAATGFSDIAGGLGRIAGAGGWGSTVLVSDLLVSDWETIVRRLAATRGDAAVIHVVAKEEIEPQVRGDLALVDSETGVELDVSVSAEVLAGYKARLTGWLANVAAACRKRGIRYIQVDPTEDLSELVMVDMRREGLVR